MRLFSFSIEKELLAREENRESTPAAQSND